MEWEMFIQIIQEYMYLPDMLVERFLFIIFFPTVTLKSDSGKIILPHFFIPSSVLVWTPQV